MKVKFKRLLTVGLAVMLIFGCMSVPVFAKTRKIKPDSRSYSSSVKKVEKRAARIKKGAQRIVVPSSGRAYLKFVAPKNGDYIFEVSDVKKKKGSNSARGMLSFMKTQKDNYKYLRYITVGAYGGKNVSLNFGTPEQKYGVSKSAWYLEHRSGRTHLVNGEVVYLYIETNARSFNLKIKSK